MKNIARILVVLLALAMMIPMAITTSFAAATDWTLFGGKWYTSSQLFLQSDPLQHGYSVTESNGVISVYSPTFREFGVPADGRITSNMAALTNENVTPLDNLSVTLKPGAGFTFDKDAKGISDSLFMLWTVGHPLTVSQLLAAQADYADIPYQLSIGELMGDALRSIVANPYTDLNEVDHPGDIGLGVCIDNMDAGMNGTMTATRAMIYLFDGTFQDANNGKYGYRWDFAAVNFVPQHPNGNDYGIYSFDERIQCAEGVTFKVVPDTTLGYKVFINGKDFSDGQDVGYFPHNINFGTVNGQSGTIGDQHKYEQSMTYARADIDLSALQSLGNGYLTVGTTGQSSNKVGYTVDVVAVNGVAAAQWDGSANDTTHTHSWTQIVNVPASCYVPGTHIYQCSCGEVKNTQFVTHVSAQPEYTMQNELRALREECEALYGSDYHNNPDYIARRNEILMKVYYATTDALVHDFVYNVTTAPTCTTEGERTKTCANNCGFTPTTEVIAPLGHIWSSWSYTNAGADLTRTCSRCNGTETVTLPSAGNVNDFWYFNARNFANLLNDPEDITNNDHFSAYATATGEVVILDAAAAYNEGLKLPITKATAKFSTPLDGFSVNVSNIQGEANGFPVGNYSLSFLLTNRPDKYWIADQYSTNTTSPNTMTQARFGYLRDDYSGSEYDVCVTLLDALFVDLNNDGTIDTSNGEMQVGTYGDGVYDAVTFGTVVDGVGYGFSHEEVSIPMDQAIDLRVEYEEIEDPNDGSMSYVGTFYFNNASEGIEVDVGNQLDTDGYYFSAASVGMTPDDLYAGTTVMTNTATLAATSFQINSICGEKPASFIGTEHENFPGVNWYVDNYDFVIRNGIRSDSTYVNLMRIAPGVWTTSNEIRNAPGMISVSEALCRSKTDANGVLTYNMINGGVYSFFIRYSDNTSFILSGVDMTNFTPDVEKIEGITFTMKNLYLDSTKGIRDFWISRGRLTTYDEARNSANNIVRITAANIEAADYNYKRGYKYEVSYLNASQDGWYTIWVRTYDGKSYGIQKYVAYPEPEVIVNGLQSTVTELAGIKCVRVAPGEWFTAADVKRAAGVRVFTGKTILKNLDEYTIQYRTDGWYSLSIEYNGGYTVVTQIQIAHFAPTITINADNSVTLGDLDQLYIIRYAPNPKNSTDWSQGFFKQAAGNRYAKTANLVNGEFTTEVLPTLQYKDKNGDYQTSAIWSFMVQYTEESYNIITVNFTTGTVTTIKP